MHIKGHLRKMKTEHSSPVRYHIPFNDELLPISDYIGKTITFKHLGDIHCIACGKKTSKSFSQGYCFPCMRSLAECDSCMISPEKCHYDEGTCRDEAWGQQHCFIDHYVYLANSSGLKVGITRETNVPFRWMDQGAAMALPIYKTKNRLLSGLVESSFKKQVNDKTSWQRMLKGKPEAIDLAERRNELFKNFDKDIAEINQQYGDDAVEKITDASPLQFDFPVESYPEKVKSLNFDKTAEISGILNGIKAQYLILDTGVLNIRKFAGYLVEFSSK